MKLEVKDLSNNKVEDIELEDSIFSAIVRKDIMARVVKWQLAKRRSGSHKVKTRADVKHTTKKPFNQKGTGRARQGMKSAPHMRGGGVAFGPVVRDHSIGLQKKVRVMGLKSAISSKLKEGKLIVVDDLALDTYKTASLKSSLSGMGVDKSTLFVDAAVVNDNFKKACSNLIKVDVLPQIGLNVYDILTHENLIFTKAGVKELTERLNGK